MQLKKFRGYRVRIDADGVEVEHRVVLRPAHIAGWVLLCLGVFFLVPSFRHDVVGLFQSPEPFVSKIPFIVVHLYFLVLLAFLGGITWTIIAVGEVLRCDSKELRFASKDFGGRWHRNRFLRTEVVRLERIIYGGPKQRTYPVLTFMAQGIHYRILEEISDEDADQVLSACRALGYDVFVDHVGKAMLRDIERRGWWVNPLRPDDYGTEEPSSDTVKQ